MNSTIENSILKPNSAQAPSAAKLEALHSEVARNLKSPFAPSIGGLIDNCRLSVEQLPPWDINRASAEPLEPDDAGIDPLEQTPLDLVRELLPGAVLLKVMRGTKRASGAGWRDLTLADMTESYFATFGSSNIAVVVGSASSGICSIDVDNDDDLVAFLDLNPRLREALQTRRVRGGNIWLRPTNGPKKLHKIKAAAGNCWGEWRADGGYTMIQGEAIDARKGETTPTTYQIVVHAPPLDINFDEIVWPSDLRLPWIATPVAQSHPANYAPIIPQADDGAPIILPGGKISITECADKLFRRIAPAETMFMRGGAIMERETHDDGSIGLAVLKPSAFRSRIEGFGQLLAWRTGARGAEVLKPTTCPEETAKALMEALEARQLLPRISTVVNCPVALEVSDGLTILGKGYHPDNGGILVINGDSPPEVPICEAVETLGSLIAEFDFQTPGDRSRALASLIAPALKLGNFIKGFVPADVAEADQSQSGKTYRQRLGCAIYNETPSLIAARSGGVGSVDESFSQALIGGKPFIQLDNVRGRMDSQYIEAFLTAVGGFGARVPHRGEVQVDPQRFLMLMTSNGVESTRDFANRSSIIRIRKRVGFSYPCYPEGDLLSHVKANQPRFLGCVFAVIREWIEFGKPRTSVTEHDFKEWAQTLDWIVQNVFHAAPLLDGHLCAQERVSNPALSFLRVVALEVRSAGKLGQVFYAGDIVDLCDEAGIEIPGVKAGGNSDPSLKVGVSMRRAFGTSASVDVDQFTVTRCDVVIARPGGGTYPRKAYRFHE
jgi:hypothetical protein